MDLLDDYLRVTQVLKPFSGMDKIPEHILEKAAQRGTRVHEICDLSIEHIPLIDVEEEYAGYIESFQKWAYNKKFGVKPPRLYDHELKITGEIDAYFIEENENFKTLTLVDFKTSKKFGRTWDLQLGAYYHLMEKNGYNINGGIIVQLNKDGSFPKETEYHFMDLCSKFNMFMGILILYRKYLFDYEK